MRILTHPGHIRMNAVRVQIMRIVDHANEWQLMNEIRRAAFILRAAGEHLNEIADLRHGAGRRA